MVSGGESREAAAWRATLHEVIFEADTAAGKAFDVGLLLLITGSLIAVSIETVEPYGERYGRALHLIEWGFTALFSVEYVLRLLCVRRPAAYARSFYGIVDLLAVLPTYLSALIPGAQSFLMIRGLRLLRIFRVFKLGRFLGEADVLRTALIQSRRKIIVFLATILTVIAIIGALMYLIEGAAAGFTSIPRSMYWAIVTMTTVGYGDISPQTPLGQLLASIVMIMGYGILAVPTGIFSVELIELSRKPVSTQACPSCAREGHDADATHCKFCGASL
jgi:voltage-gated potassium channel